MSDCVSAAEALAHGEYATSSSDDIFTKAFGGDGIMELRNTRWTNFAIDSIYGRLKHSEAPEKLSRGLSRFRTSPWIPDSYEISASSRTSIMASPRLPIGCLSLPERFRSAR